jgi:hypothetical protein
MVAYQSATTLIQITIDHFELQPVLCSRVWRIWSFAFSAAVRESMARFAGCADNDLSRLSLALWPSEDSAYHWTRTHLSI